MLGDSKPSLETASVLPVITGVFGILKLPCSSCRFFNARVGMIYGDGIGESLLIEPSLFRCLLLLVVSVELNQKYNEIVVLL